MSKKLSLEIQKNVRLNFYFTRILVQSDKNVSGMLLFRTGKAIVFKSRLPIQNEIYTLFKIKFASVQLVLGKETSSVDGVLVVRLTFVIASVLWCCRIDLSLTFEPPFTLSPLSYL